MDALTKWFLTLAIKDKEIVKRSDYPDIVVAKGGELQPIEWEDLHHGRPRASYVFILFSASLTMSQAQVGWAIKNYIYKTEVHLEGLPGKLWCQPCRNETERRIRTCLNGMRAYLHLRRESVNPVIPEFCQEMGHDIRTIGGSYRPRAETVTWKGATVAILKQEEQPNGEMSLSMSFKPDEDLVKIFQPDIAAFSVEAFKKGYDEFLANRKPAI